MENLIVSMERSGVMRRVGLISGNNASDSRFSYSEDYLGSDDAAPVSLSLPLQTEAFSPAQTKNFFEGLLPEGFTRRTVAQWMHVAEDDYLPILHGLGRECLGALCITVEGEETDAAYTLLKSPVQVVITKSGATVSATVDGNAVNMSAVGTSAHALVPFTIINTRGFDLPQTGGTGNWLFPVIGLIMLAFCVTGIVILMKKKPAQE